MRIAFASARSSPGVTTAVLALASAWQGKVLLVEASEDGGALAVRFGLRLEPGLTTLAAAIRHDADAATVPAHVQVLPGTDGRLEVLVGPPTPESAHLLLRNAGDRLATTVAQLVDRSVLIDAGRLPAQPAALPFLTGADRVVLIARPRAEDLQTLALRLPTLRELGIQPRLVLVGDVPYKPDEIAATLGITVIGVLADDRSAADALAGVGASRRLDRSRLLRSAASMLSRLMAPEAATATTPQAPIGAPDDWTSASVWAGKAAGR